VWGDQEELQPVETKRGRKQSRQTAAGSDSL
jgi:hypothetical protein